MPHPQFSNEEIVRRGEEIYDLQLREKLEAQYEDKIVIINIENGEYEIDDDALTASKRALAKHPGAAIYGLRVGSHYIYEFSGIRGRAKQ